MNISEKIKHSLYQEEILFDLLCTDDGGVMIWAT